MIARKLIRLHTELGGWGSVLYAIDRLCQRLRLPIGVRSYFVVAQPVHPRPLLSRRRGGDFTFREVCPGQPALDEMPLERETLDFRFAQGARCFGLFRDGGLIAYIWLQTGPFDEDVVRCRFEPQPPDCTCWDFDVYVRPTDRLTPAFLRLWDAANARLRAEGVSYSLSRISAFNLASLRSHRRLGAEVVGRTDFLTLGPVQLLISTLRPFLHLSLSRRSRPRIPVSVSHLCSGDSGASVAVEAEAAAE